MKMQVSFCVYATMTVDMDDDVDLEQYERDFGNGDNPFELETIDNVYVLSFEEIKDNAG